MVFSSLSFIFVILPLFLVCDNLVRKIGNTFSRNIILLIVSLLFYIWGDTTNVFLLLALGIINFFGAKQLHRSKGPLFLAILIVVNISVLFIVKYAFWVSGLIDPELMKKNIRMPLGISFFTFHAISYIIDVHRKTIEPARNVWDFLTYFCMFPHLVAGPIVRFAQVQNEMKDRWLDKDLFAFGIYRFLVGLNKKVLIANTVSILADSAFTMAPNGYLHGIDAWIGILAYTVQIYFDFSGYSDMAIGLAAMAGFRFEENFKRPYSSKSLRDFWRRWHISLSSWLRDYLYIPLGGNRGGTIATYRNLFLVFFICGLWHGANFTFVVWGVWHGLFLIFERLPLGKAIDKMPLPLARLYAMLVVIIGWVFFKADSLTDAIRYISIMFGSEGLGKLTLEYHFAGMLALAVAIVLCAVPDKVFPSPSSHTPAKFSFGFYGIQALLAVLSIRLLLVNARNPFIYFNF